MSKAIVEAVHSQFPHLLRYNSHASCTEFLQRVLLAIPPGERWGHLSKQDGEAGHELPNGVRVSYDVICHKQSGLQVDIINGGGAHPNPGGPAWQPIDPAVYRAHNVWTPMQPLFDSGTPGGGEVSVAELGIGVFPAIRACKEWPEDLSSDCDWIDEHLFGEHAGYARVFLDVEGSDHGDPDPWRDAGCDIRAASWSDDYKRMLDFFGNRGWGLLLTMYGSPNHARTRDEHRRNLERFGQATQGRWEMIRLVETANEWRVNRWSLEQLVSYARDVRDALPPFIPTAVSSPHLAHSYTDAGHEATNEEMADSIAELYGWVKPTDRVEIGVHVMRGPLTLKWGDPFAYNSLTRLPLYNGEPFGVGASAGGDIADPAATVAHYKRTSDAGWRRYTTHCAWSVFAGRLPTEYRRSYDVRHISQHTNMEAIAHALRDYRATGKVIIPPGGGGGGDEMPLPDRDELRQEMEWLHGYYQADEGLQRPEGLWLNGKPDFEGISAWLLDVYVRQRQAGKSREQARAEVQRQIELSEEWRSKHNAA